MFCMFVCMSALFEFCLSCLYYLQYERGVRFDVNIMLLVWSDAAWTFSVCDMSGEFKNITRSIWRVGGRRRTRSKIRILAHGI